MPDLPCLSIDDLLKFRSPTSVAISPDGRYAVYVLKEVDSENNGYQRHLWRCELDSGELRQLTSGKGSCTAPRWSPDGRWIVFCSNRDEKKETELWLLPTDGGEAQQLTSCKGTVADPSWSPASDALVFGYRLRDVEPETDEEKHSQPDYRHTTRLSYKLDGDGFLPSGRWQVMHLTLADRSLRALTEGPFDHHGARFSPDGQQVVLTANRSEPLDLDIERTDLWLVPAAGGQLRQLTDSQGPAEMPQFSPDGQAVYYVGHTGEPGQSMIENHHLWRVPLAGGPAEDLTPELDRCLGNLTLGDVRDADFFGPPPVIAADGGTIYLVISDSGTSRLWRFDTATAQLCEVSCAAADVFSADLAEETLVYLASDFDNAGELYLHQPGGGRKLTQLNPWLAERRLLPVETFCDAEGRTLWGLAHRAAGGRRSAPDDSRDSWRPAYAVRSGDDARVPGAGGAGTSGRLFESAGQSGLRQGLRRRDPG